MNKFWKLIPAVLICESVGIGAGLLTASAIPGWYATLIKPAFSPPNWVFGPVWTILYAMMGVSAYLIWEQGVKKRAVRVAIAFFMLQLILNFFWSLIFFGAREIFFAFVDIAALWITILITMLLFYPISKVAAYLLVPYFLWVSFATILNFAILILNS